MAQERTCVLGKPDTICRKHVGEVVNRFESNGLRLLGMKMIHLSRPQAEGFYKEHHGKPFYEGLIAFMTSAPIVAMAWEGENAVTKARSLMGATDSLKADKGTLRQQFGTDNRYNAVHGSDSPKSAEREIAYFFKPEELFNYTQEDYHGKSKETSHSISPR